ncbi:MAG: pyridoxamine 5'-phosphate oxidase family protein [Candidatus Freyarchaeota archaeon]|nr:pyridoxamine 5'-phosphate oxidase family protein [Candidatus Jordarchaeia archaeon]
MSKRLEAWAEKLLRKPILARVATVNENCMPHVTPVWFLYEDGYIYFSVQKKTIKARNIMKRPYVSVVIDEVGKDGTAGIMMSGRAEVIEDLKLFDKISEKYLGSADHPAAKVLRNLPRIIVKLKPEKVASWKF